MRFIFRSKWAKEWSPRPFKKVTKSISVQTSCFLLKDSYRNQKRPRVKNVVVAEVLHRGEDLVVVVLEAWVDSAAAGEVVVVHQVAGELPEVLAEGVLEEALAEETRAIGAGADFNRIDQKKKRHFHHVPNQTFR